MRADARTFSPRPEQRGQTSRRSAPCETFGCFRCSKHLAAPVAFQCSGGTATQINEMALGHRKSFLQEFEGTMDAGRDSVDRVTGCQSFHLVLFVARVKRTVHQSGLGVLVQVLSSPPQNRINAGFVCAWCTRALSETREVHRGISCFFHEDESSRCSTRLGRTTRAHLVEHYAHRFALIMHKVALIVWIKIM